MCQEGRDQLTCCHQERPQARLSQTLSHLLTLSKNGISSQRHGDRDHVVSMHIYLLRPGLQLLPLLQTDLPHTGQQVMRWGEDPRAQEKCEDVRLLKKIKKEEKEQNTKYESGLAWPQVYSQRAATLDPATSQAQHHHAVVMVSAWFTTP